MRVRGAAACALGLLAAACGAHRDAPPRAAAGAAHDSGGAVARDSARADTGQWCQLADARVETAIAAVARQRDGDEYCEDRHYAVDDVDGDSLDDLVVTFDLEQTSGGSDESWVMVFLTSREGRAPLLLEIDDVGDDHGERYPTGVSIDGQYVVVDFSDYLPGDPDCCPSGSSTARFLVTPDSIFERAPSRRPPRPGGRSS